MSQRPSEGIGQRIAEYRRLAGLSARELAERTGMGLTRGVVANLESGRKSDLTVDQLIALADILAVPPIALALPLESPFRFLRLTDSDSESRMVRTYIASPQFTGESLPDSGGMLERTTGATAVAYGRWRKLEELVDAHAALRELRASKEPDPDEETKLQSDVLRLERELRHLGVDLTLYRIDDEPVPDADGSGAITFGGAREDITSQLAEHMAAEAAVYDRVRRIQPDRERVADHSLLHQEQ